MSERNEHGERRQAEGVRIIGPEEAQAALDAGAAAGRRPDDELRFGDVPPQPSGPRPPHRFPLPDSVDPAGAVPRPPVVPPARVDPVVPSRPRPPVGDDAHDARPWYEPADPAGHADPTVPADDPQAAHAATAEHAVVPPPEPQPPEPPPLSPGLRIAAPQATEAAAGSEHTGPVALPSAPYASAEPAAQGAGAPVAGGDDEGPVEPAWLARARAPWPEAGPSTRSTDPVAPPAPEVAVTGEMPLVPGGARPGDVRPVDSDAAEGEPAAPVAPAAPAAAGPRPADPTVPLDAAPARRARLSRRRPGRPAPDPLIDTSLHLPDEGTAVSGTDLPHWTDPPTGEVPRILADRGDDDLGAWEALGGRTTTWRDDTTGWGHVDSGLDDLVGDDEPLGALDTSRTEHSDLFSFDEDFERLEEERSGQHRVVAADAAADHRFADADDGADYGDYGDDAEFGFDDETVVTPQPVRVGSRPEPRPRRGSPRPAGRRRPPGDGGGGPTGGRPQAGGADLRSRVVVGVGLVVALLIATAVGPAALVVLAAAVITVAGAEVFGILRPIGFKPATLLGLVGIVGVVFAAYWRGPAALPLVTVLVFVGSMCWYLFKVVDARPLANAAVTTLAFAWVGLLGSYAALLLRLPHGRGLFIGAVVPAVVDDIVAYFTGRQIGSRPLAPSISPGKTWEGAIGGGIAAVVAGLVIGHSLAPWGGLKHGFVLGVVIALLAPIGDLFESMVKRDLDVKDSGTVLSGHGGVLDRFDAVLLVLPAAYYLASWWHLVH